MGNKDPKPPNDGRHDVTGNGKRDYDRDKVRDPKDDGGSGKHGKK